MFLLFVGSDFLGGPVGNSRPCDQSQAQCRIHRRIHQIAHRYLRCLPQVETPPVARARKAGRSARNVDIAAQANP